MKSEPPLAELAARLPDERWPMLLDGAGDDERYGRWRLLVFDPLERLTHRASDTPVARELRAFPKLAAAMAARWPDATRDANRDIAPDPIAAGSAQRPPDSLSQATCALDDTPPFAGGAVGWFAYDLGRELEALPAELPADAPLPDLLVGLYGFVIAERVGGGPRFLLSVDGEPGLARGAALYDELLALPPADHSRAGPFGALRTTLPHADYLAAVNAAREAILDGDIYQVNLSQRFELGWRGGAAALAERLRAHHPSPFGALLRSEQGSVVSNSPELFLRRRGASLLSRPIKGTRPRGDTPELDSRLRAELEASPKENAELAMIVDLARNDLGRVARMGGVSVQLPFETDAWPTVFHRVVGVHAELPRDVDLADLLEATFPPASVTGTPKLSALAHIERLERVRRHVYTGALGWIAPDGDMDLSVAIRIATLHAERLLVPVGGGITLASEAEAEFQETLHKGRAFFEVLGVQLDDQLHAEATS
ncbi:MAG: hypothetical protein DHS20C15_06200 [Planctomycetota bacterium]|nr:MAG: hypothetical protein DHS20C15_06200 [Planctomycetota bacterium]